LGKLLLPLVFSIVLLGLGTQLSEGALPIDFEGFSDGAVITDDYKTDGVIFSSSQYSIQILDDSGEVPPGPPSGANILVSNSGANNGDIIISIVDPTTFTPTDASSIQLYLYSVGNSAVTVESKNSVGDVLDTQVFQNNDVGGVNCDYPTRPDCPGPITNGWGQTDFYTFSGAIRTVTITSDQSPGDGYGIDDVSFTPAGNTEANANDMNGNQLTAIGGDIIPLDTTMVLVSGAQYTAAWMIPVIVSGIGFAIVIARKF